MANKLKARNRKIRVELASKASKDLMRQNPGWSLQQINDAAYKAADLQIKRGEVPASRLVNTDGWYLRHRAEKDDVP